MKLERDKAKLLKSYFERIRSMEEERRKASSDISEEWKAIKDSGFDVKAAREAYRRLYKLDQDVRDAADVYEEVLGKTPLEAAIESITIKSGDSEVEPERADMEAA